MKIIFFICSMSFILLSNCSIKTTLKKKSILNNHVDYLTIDIDDEYQYQLENNNNGYKIAKVKYEGGQPLRIRNTSNNDINNAIVDLMNNVEAKEPPFLSPGPHIIISKNNKTYYYKEFPYSMEMLKLLKVLNQTMNK